MKVFGKKKIELVKKDISGSVMYKNPTEVKKLSEFIKIIIHMK